MPNGYRDVKLNPVVNGHLCEIQLQLRRFFNLKAGQHVVYEWARQLKVTTETEANHLIKALSREVTQEMIRLAEQNWRGTGEYLPHIQLDAAQYGEAEEAFRQVLIMLVEASEASVDDADTVAVVIAAKAVPALLRFPSSSATRLYTLHRISCTLLTPVGSMYYVSGFVRWRMSDGVLRTKRATNGEKVCKMKLVPETTSVLLWNGRYQAYYCCTLWPLISVAWDLPANNPHQDAGTENCERTYIRSVSDWSGKSRLLTVFISARLSFQEYNKVCSSTGDCRCLAYTVAGCGMNTHTVSHFSTRALLASTKNVSGVHDHQLFSSH